jgi:hypothetical protein
MFGMFVLYHIDGLMSPEQNRTIIDSAANRCFAGARAFCERLEAEARKPPGRKWNDVLQGVVKL